MEYQVSRNRFCSGLEEECDENSVSPTEKLILLKSYRMKLTWLWILFYIPLFVNAQTDGARYRIEFTDKAGTKYDIAHPELFLTQRALLRRERYHISIDERDLPVSGRYLDSLKKHGLNVLYTSRWFNFATVSASSPDDTSGILRWSFIRSIRLTKPASILKGAYNKWSTPNANTTENLYTEPGDNYGYAGTSSQNGWNVSVIHGA